MDWGLRVLVALLASGAVGCSNGGEPDQAPGPEYCSTITERPPRAVFALNARSELGPRETAVNVQPGERLCLVADVENNRVVHLRLAKYSREPQRTIVMSFGWDGYWSTLAVNNPYPVDLDYKVGHRHARQMGLFPAGSCPAPPGSPAVQSWPYPVEFAVVFDLRLDQQAAWRRCPQRQPAVSANAPR